MQEDGRRVRFYLVQFVVIKSEDASGERNRVQMHGVILYDQPAVPIIVAIFILLPIFDQVLPKPLTDLHHEGDGAKEDLVPHGCDDEDGGQLSHLRCVVLLLSVHKA